ncbi:MAG: DUF4363 family protein [Oscillospiraceae bacterium]|nr:DUF4363 family protein [Oscillospiraceae bacterium]MDD4414262.1 DUF4363 family protein [Oscillospiraceae bacterium]
MKRIIVAAAILIAVATLCIVTLKIQTNNIKELLTITDKMQKAYEDDKIEYCLELSYEFVEKFDKKTNLFPLFMRHSDISKIEEIAVSLPVLLETDNIQHFAPELIKCRIMLKNMADLESPTPENIL